MRDRVDEPLLHRQADRPVVERRSLAFDRGEQLVAERVEHDAEHRPAIDREADADREEGQAVGVVHGAIERVDDPQPSTGLDPASRRRDSGGRWRVARLLREEGVRREHGADRLDDRRLGEMVDLGDDVLLALVDDALEALIALEHDRTGRPRGDRRGRQLVAEVGDAGHHPIVAARRGACRPRRRISATSGLPLR